MDTHRNMLTLACARLWPLKHNEREEAIQKCTNTHSLKYEHGYESIYTYRKDMHTCVYIYIYIYIYISLRTRKLTIIFQ